MSPPFVVLLVDDDPDEIRLLELLLDETGLPLDVVVTTSGEEALDHLRARDDDGPDVDLVLLDVHLPGMNGYQVLDSIRADSVLRSLKVVLQTSAATRDAERRGAKHGADHTLLKPTSAEVLSALLAPPA